MGRECRRSPDLSKQPEGAAEPPRPNPNALPFGDPRQPLRQQGCTSISNQPRHSKHRLEQHLQGWMLRGHTLIHPRQPRRPPKRCLITSGRVSALTTGHFSYCDVTRTRAGVPAMGGCSPCQTPRGKPRAVAEAARLPQRL